MDVLVKGLGACLAALATVFALAHARAIAFARTTGPASGLEIQQLFPGRVGSEDLAALVLEPPPPPTRIPASASSRGDGGSVANRNSNPLNIKLGSDTRRYVESGQATISDIIPTDGGRFLKFDAPETGFRAAVELMSALSYDGVNLDNALRRWSHNGYGAEILADTELDTRMPAPYLRRDDLGVLLYRMAAAEGYKSAAMTDEIQKALRSLTARSSRRPSTATSD